MNASVALSHAAIVDGQLAAYNAQDIEAFLGFYADDAALGAFNGELHTKGLAAIRQRHEKLFAEFPQNKAEIVNRMVVGPHLVDHERVVRAPGGETFDVITIYSFADGKIARVDFAK